VAFIFNVLVAVPSSVITVKVRGPGVASLVSATVARRWVLSITSTLRTVTPGPDTSTELIEKKFVDRPVMVTLVGAEPGFSELGLTERI
jgi:hypothetical protein